MLALGKLSRYFSKFFRVPFVDLFMIIKMYFRFNLNSYHLLRNFYVPSIIPGTLCKLFDLTFENSCIGFVKNKIKKIKYD